MPHVETQGGKRLLYLVVACLMLAQAGCLVATAGLVAGGAVAAGYVYSKGWYYHEFSANLDDSLVQVRAALGELRMPIEEEKPVKGKIYIASRTGDDRKVRITLEGVSSPIPSEGFMTRVWVRVVYLGDEAISTRILDQISKHLPSVSPAPPGAVPATPPAAGPLQPVSAASPIQSAEPQTAEPKLATVPPTPVPVGQQK